jgi:hypothetical protein
MTAIVKTAITVIVMTSSMSVHPPDDLGAKGKGEKVRDFFPSPLPHSFDPAALIDILPRALTA